MQARIKVAVVGVGRMGRHHARTYKQLPQAQLCGVVDADIERARTVADDHGCAAYASAEALLQAEPGLKAVSVAVPTVAHHAQATWLLEHGVHCLVEKPLASTVADAKAMAGLAQQRGLVLQVGHTERFNPAVRAVAAMDLPVRFMEVQRVSPMTFRSLDVGVVMDLMIHDLDIVLSFAAAPLREVQATGVSVFGPHEDIANARLVFANGCVANLTASRLAMRTERRLRLFSEEAYVNLDYQKRKAQVIRRSRNSSTLGGLRDLLASGVDMSKVDYASLIQMDELEMPDDGSLDPLTAELASFLEAVTDAKPAVVDGWAGVAAVDAAERMVAEIQSHRWEGLQGTVVP